MRVVVDKRLVNGEWLAGVELIGRLIGGNGIVNVARCKRESAIDIVIQFCIRIKAKAKALAVAYLRLIRRTAEERLIPQTEVTAESKRADLLQTVLDTLYSLDECLVRLGDCRFGVGGS